MEARMRITGTIVRVLRFYPVVSISFKKKDKEVLDLKDVGKLLPSYACTIRYVLDIEIDSAEILNCISAERLPGTFPLKYNRMRRALSETKFSSSTLTLEFKGRGKDEYSNERELVEHIRNDSIRNCVLSLFDRHFQPPNYYFVACYLHGPELLSKTEEELKKLQNLLIYSPSLSCFLSRFVTDSAVRGVDDLRYSDAVRLSENLEKEEDLIKSEHFSVAVSLYQKLLSELKRFGTTDHYIEDTEQNNEALEYLIEHEYLKKLPRPNNYMLGFVAEYGDGAIYKCVKQLLERIPVNEQRRISVDKYSYEPSYMPLLLIRHCASNHHETLKYIVEQWESDKDRLCRDVAVLCENLYHSTMLETKTKIPVTVYCEGNPPEIRSNVGLVIIERAHLWDSILLGRLLLYLKPRLGHLNIIMCGDDREMPICPRRGAGAVFSDLYNSKLFPVIYVNDSIPAPTVVDTPACLNLLLKGNRARIHERGYSDFQCMTLSEFMAHDQMQLLRSEIGRDERKAVRIICGTQEQQKELYEKVRTNVWKAKGGWKRNIYYANEAVYSSKLKQSLFAEATVSVFRTTNKGGSCSVEYRQDKNNFPCICAPTNYTKVLVLQEHNTKLQFLVPLHYEEGLQPATVQLYGQIQTYNYNDITYLLIDEDTSWRAIYSAAVKTTEKFCLVYPDDCNIDELLDHILDNNWKKYSRRGALLQLLIGVENTAKRRKLNPQ